MFDVACIGNALIDSFLTIHEANELLRIDEGSKELHIRLGEKIPLDKAQFELGGNACNVSVGLSRLGHRATLIAEIGDDAFSNRIKNSLTDEKVDLSRFVTSHAPASFAMGLSFKSDRVLFVHHVERDHNFNYDGLRPKWVYLSSMGNKWQHVYNEVPVFVKQNNAMLAFNPGTRQIAEGLDALKPVLAASDILFLNKEEAARLVEGPTSLKLRGASKELMVNGSSREQSQELANKLQLTGPKIIVITDSSNGSFALDNEGNFYNQGITDATVIDKTGAGDSFASGFLSAIMYGYDIQYALKWGAMNSASVVGSVGAQRGLLTKEQMDSKIKGEA